MYGTIGYAEAFGDYEGDDYGAPRKKRRRDRNWSEKGIEAEVKHMRALADRLAKHSVVAAKKKHTRHAKVLVQMAAIAKAEAARLLKKDLTGEQDLSGFGDYEGDDFSGDDYGAAGMTLSSALPWLAAGGLALYLLKK